MKTTSISVTALIGESLLSLVCPTAAQALTVTVESQTYNITVTEPIKYTENVSLLQSQPWWENFNLSDKLAKAVLRNWTRPTPPTTEPQGRSLLLTLLAARLPLLILTHTSANLAALLQPTPSPRTLSACSLFRKRPLPFPVLSPSSVPLPPSA
jgi:hypothetical protein